MTFKVILATALSLAFVPFVGAQVITESVKSTSSSSRTSGWWSWRGPNQNGTSLERGLPRRVAASGSSWTHELSGRGTPVAAMGRVYAMGYEGTNAELQEIIVCLDEKTGRRIWEHRFTDFLSDIIYHRFAIGSPTIDPETHNVYCMSTSGLLTCFTADGKVVWQHSLMSEYGRLTFPNGRTGAPLVSEELCVVHIISSSWGPHGPARDRFHSFDKRTGESIWSSTPGGRPRDSSFSFPVVGMEDGKRVIYAGLGGGYVVCVNLLTGDPLWRFKLANGGLSSSVVRYKNSVIAMNGKENVDDSTRGRMVAVRCGRHPKPGSGPTELGKDDEVWRNDLIAFTSSPVLVGNRLYQTTHNGDLCSVDADNGRVIWHQKLAPDQIHASPAYGDGVLYVPMNNGTFYIVEPSDKGAKILQKTQLDGNCLGAPAISNGRIYVHTTKRLYCFAGGGGEIAGEPDPIGEPPPVGKAVRLQVIPGDFLSKTGSKVKFRVRSLDANGWVVSPSVGEVSWDNIPSDGITMTETNEMIIAADAAPTAVVVTAELKGMRGFSRVRVVPAGKIVHRFESTPLAPDPRTGLLRAAPPSHWPGAGPKWEVLNTGDETVLAKTLTNPLFQRTITSIGHPDASNYTMTVDIKTDGNRRIMSSGGLINQRYLVALKGNYQELEVSSNMELLRRSVPFRWTPKTWYRMKSRVDVSKDGSGWIRAKVWLRSENEPDKWTIEVPHSHIHRQGAPGIYGFVPQSRFRVYLDNITVIPNA